MYWCGVVRLLFMIGLGCLGLGMFDLLVGCGDGILVCVLLLFCVFVVFVC